MEGSVEKNSITPSSEEAIRPVIEKLQNANVVVPKEEIKLVFELKTKIYKEALEAPEFYEIFVKRVRDLKNKYGRDCQEYLVYHILTGSTFQIGSIKSWDFPNDDSLIKFLKNLFQQKESKNNQPQEQA